MITSVLSRIVNDNDEAFPNTCPERRACVLGGPFDQDSTSQSSVDNNRINMFDYVSAHIFGGVSGEFVKMIEQLKRRTDANAAKGVVPFVHDESMLNW
jgi:hypothetical protein